MYCFNHTFRRTASRLNIWYAWFEAMHSRLDIFIEGLSEIVAGEVTSSVYAEVKRLDAKLNRFDENSDVYHLNNRNLLGEYLPDDELLYILDDALRYRRLTYGSFDICIQSPDFMAGTDYYSVDLEKKVLKINRDDAVFDFGGYAKGYALQKVKDIVVGNGVKNALLSFGNSTVYALGRHPLGNEWEIGVEDPDDKTKTIALIKLSDSALSTSGNTPLHSAHIKSPDTGVWNVDRKIISVQSPSVLDCEVLSTALFAALPDKRSQIEANFSLEKVMEFEF